MAIETGTGVTMTADKAYVTQWLAWVLMILTGSTNRRGGICPGTQSFMGEWPCAALPDEIEAGNIRAALNLGGSLLLCPNTDVRESGPTSRSGTR